MDVKYKELDEYLLGMAGATKDFKEEWGWLRYQVGGKMFAALLHPRKCAAEYADKDLLSLKCDPMEADFLRREHCSVIWPGFYMDKRTWNTIDLNEELPCELMLKMCEASYKLVFSKLTKKLQAEILEAAGSKKK